MKSALKEEARQASDGAWMHHRWMRPATYLLPLAIALLSGCFATQQDIRVLQSDLMLIRSEAAAADSARKVQIEHIDQAIRSLGQLTKLNDSLAAFGSTLARFRSDMAGSMAAIEQQLLQIQELTGQSQRLSQEVRASLESRQSQIPPAGTPLADQGEGQGQPGAPGPNELYKVAMEQYNQGSYQAARTAFNELLNLHPKSDLVAPATFYIAQSFAAEGNAKAADSVYGVVVSKYPKSPVAAGALYKRARAAVTSGKIPQARTFFNRIIKEYPRTDEAVLAKEQLQALDRDD